MKRLLTSLGFLILATGCNKLNSPIGPSETPSENIPAVTTATLAGVVTQMTSDGAVPVEGATVEVLQNSDPGDMSRTAGKARPKARPGEYFAVGAVVTDASGRYAFEGLSFGTYSIRVSKEGFVLYSTGDFAFAGDTEMNAELTAEEKANPGRLRIRR